MSTADELRANSSLGPVEYRGPVLGLIFLAFAEHRFDALRPELDAEATERRPISPEDFRAQGVVFNATAPSGPIVPWWNR